MAGSFVSPSAPSSKMKVGKANRPKRSGDTPHPFGEKAHDPHRHGSSSIPGFDARKSKTNPKYGFHSSPGKAPAGRLGRINKDSCASAGKIVRHHEKGHSAAQRQPHLK